MAGLVGGRVELHKKASGRDSIAVTTGFFDRAFRDEPDDLNVKAASFELLYLSGHTNGA